jgi:hypothetical protein
MTDPRLSRTDSKKGRLQRAALAVLLVHSGAGARFAKPVARWLAAPLRRALAATGAAARSTALVSRNGGR